MKRFLQLHLLTSYPPSNLNRDDLGRPKTALMGGANRLRISSQSLKRAWRKSDIFESALAGHIGKRTKSMGVEVFKTLIEKGVKEKDAIEWARKIAGVFGKVKSQPKKAKKDDDKESEKNNKKYEQFEIEQLCHFSPEEENAINELVDAIASSGEAPSDDQLKLLRKDISAVDIALFGRMLADNPKHNIEASAQVAHAITTHKVAVEEDFFTAVDDLNKGEEDRGAGHLGETEFSSGLFYLYICINREQLKDNLCGDGVLVKKTITALVEAMATIAPSGKQNSFASRARASYILCETGDQQPRSLSVSFLKAIKGESVEESSIKSLEKTLKDMDNAYGACSDDRCTMNVSAGEGTLQDIIKCATE